MLGKIFLVALGLTGSLASARNTIPTARLDWFHSSGHFHSLAFGPGRTGDSWVEQIGNTRYQFQERMRNQDYVEIYDPSRKVAVRLFSDHCELKFDDQLNYLPLYSGGWDTRRIFYTAQNPGGRPYFQQIQNNQWWFVPAGTNGPLTFDTIERTNDKIVLRGHGRTYWLFDTSVEYRDGDNGPTEIFIFDGYWDEISQPR